MNVGEFFHVTVKDRASNCADISMIHETFNPEVRNAAELHYERIGQMLITKVGLGLGLADCRGRRGDAIIG